PAALARAALGLHAIGTRTWWPPDQVVALLSEALDAFGSKSGGEPLRLHVMASLSRALAWHGLDLPRARTLAAEAVAAARAGGDRSPRAGRPRVPRGARRIPAPGGSVPPAAVPLRRAGPPGRAGPAGRQA